MSIEKLNSEFKKALAYSLIRRSMVRKMPYSRFNLPWNKIKQLRDEEYSYAKYKRKRAYHNQSFKEHFLSNLQEYNNAVFNNHKQNKSFNMDIFDLIPKNSVESTCQPAASRRFLFLELNFIGFSQKCPCKS